jgi:hypothetical protein
MLGILWCKSQLGAACPVVVCPGRVWYGGFRQGKAIVADGSTEDASPLCCSLKRVVKAESGEARRGGAGQGLVH